MTKTIIALSAVATFMATAGCSNDVEPSTADESTAPSASSSATPTGASEGCVTAVDTWAAVYDALDEASALEDPTKEMTTKVLDDSEELLEPIQSECEVRVVDAAEAAHQQMRRVDATVTACEFVDGCGSRLDDEFDSTMKFVNGTRELVAM